MDTTIPAPDLRTAHPIKAGPLSRKGLGCRRWTADEDQILRQLVQAGLSDTQIASDERLKRPAQMIGYRRRLIMKDFSPQKSRNSSLSCANMENEGRSGGLPGAITSPKER